MFRLLLSHDQLNFKVFRATLCHLLIQPRECLTSTDRKMKSNLSFTKHLEINRSMCICVVDFVHRVNINISFVLFSVLKYMCVHIDIEILPEKNNISLIVVT